ncbi:MAG TPA: helix-turn-helix domain-containing protein [Polyangiales bacterium]|nr:helix-turn-helix domain-containing protein [Polyangiales bacterium]
MSPKYLFIEEVAEETRRTNSTVRHWLSKRRLASVRIGRRRMVLRADLDAFIANGLKPALDTGARGLTNRGGDPGRLTPTADPSVESAASPQLEARFKEGEDRSGFAGGEARSAEGAQPPGPCPGAPRSGVRARKHSNSGER